MERRNLRQVRQPQYSLMKTKFFRACLWATVCSVALLLSLLPAAAADKQAPARPNILFIMADDHAAHAISAYGSKINKTPNIDRLARDGMRFNNCFAVNSICSPSRACIITGKYSHINGVTVF